MISGKSLGGRFQRLPEKATMNLAQRKKRFHPHTMLPLIFVLVAGSLAVAKFAFLDPLGRKTDAYDRLSRQQEQLASVTASLKDYDEVAEKYGKYSYGYMTEDESALVDRIQVLDLIEEKLSGMATVKDFSISGNTLSVNISNVTLAKTGVIVKDLESSSLVSSVSVYTASTEGNSGSQSQNSAQPVSVSMTVTLTKSKEASK